MREVDYFLSFLAIIYLQILFPYLVDSNRSHSQVSFSSHKISNDACPSTILILVSDIGTFHYLKILFMIPKSLKNLVLKAHSGRESVQEINVESLVLAVSFTFRQCVSAKVALLLHHNERSNRKFFDIVANREKIPCRRL